MSLKAPDEWAEENGRRTGYPAWWRSVPPDVRALAQASSTSVENIVDWFRTEVAAEYPDEKWPAQATWAKVMKLLKDAPRADA